MTAEQVPGTLFVLLCTLVAWMVGSEAAILLLALGCAIGWVAMDPGFSNTRQWAFFAALLVWAAAFLYLTYEVLT